MCYVGKGKKITDIKENEIYKDGKLDTLGILGKRNIDNINTLHPSIRGAATDFLLEAQLQGFNVVMTDAYRTFEQQEELFWSSRPPLNGPWRTDARGGYSNHNFGLAFDVVEIVNGAPQYTAQSYDKFKDLAIKRGFEWGGYWPQVDMPHFQNMSGYTIAELRGKVNAGQVDTNGYVRI